MTRPTHHRPRRPADRPYDWQDRVVITACTIACVALLAILTWGR